MENYEQYRFFPRFKAFEKRKKETTTTEKKTKLVIRIIFHLFVVVLPLNCASHFGGSYAKVANLLLF